MSNLVRKYKCYKFTGKVDDLIKEIFDFIDIKLSNLSEFKHSNIFYKDMTFYMNDKRKCILYYNLNDMILCISQQNFLKVLKTKYNINYFDILAFIQYKMYITYKLKFKEIKIYPRRFFLWIEINYKLKENI